MSRTVSVRCPAIPIVQGVPALTFVRLAGQETLSRLSSYTVESFYLKIDIAWAWYFPKREPSAT